jgi:hypothetical protein
MTRVALACLLLAVLSACSWFRSETPPPLPGERIAVLDRDGALSPALGLAGAPIRIPFAVVVRIDEIGVVVIKLIHLLEQPVV